MATQIVDLIFVTEQELRDLSRSVEAKIYLFRDRILIPIVVRTEIGNRLIAEPVTVLPITDREGIIVALAATFSLGNPVAPQPASKRSCAEIALYRHARARGRRHFVQGSKRWSITKQGNAYRIQPWRPGIRGWELDLEHCMEIPETGSVLEMAAEIADLILPGIEEIPPQQALNDRAGRTVEPAAAVDQLIEDLRQRLPET